MTSGIHRQVDKILEELSTMAGTCPTCYGSPTRMVYADGESMPAEGCPTCGQSILRTHDRRSMTAAQAARLFCPAAQQDRGQP